MNVSHVKGRCKDIHLLRLNTKIMKYVPDSYTPVFERSRFLEQRQQGLHGYMSTNRRTRARETHRDTSKSSGIAPIMTWKIWKPRSSFSK